MTTNVFARFRENDEIRFCESVRGSFFGSDICYGFQMRLFYVELWAGFETADLSNVLPPYAVDAFEQTTTSAKVAAGMFAADAAREAGVKLIHSDMRDFHPGLDAITELCIGEYFENYDDSTTDRIVHAYNTVAGKVSEALRRLW